MSVNGVWSEDKKGNNTTKLIGKLKAGEIDEMAAYFGYIIPIIQSPLAAEFSLQWRNTPWNFELATLQGDIKSTLGKGRIEKVNVGQAGKLLRLVSFDALYANYSLILEILSVSILNMIRLKVKLRLIKVL